MKRPVFVIVALVGLLAMAAPTVAADLEWGGYWRTRGYTMGGFTGDSEDKSQDNAIVDARGRLWTKHIINEYLSWTNRVEFNVVWGDEEGGGGIGTDGTDYLRFKHSFVDLNTPIKGKDLYWRIGLQEHLASQGFLFDDDFAGLKLFFELGPSEIEMVWMKAFEGAALSSDDDYDDYVDSLDDFDVDFYGLASKFNLADDALMLKPFVYYMTSEDARAFSGTTGNKDVDVFYLGADLQYTLDALNIWAVLMYETGTAGIVSSDQVEFDVSAYLGALGAEVTMGPLGFHGEIFYSSGDSDMTDTDVESFYVPRGQSHYWSEIMGLGVFDSFVSNGSPGDAVSANTCGIIAYNLGLSYAVSDNLDLRGDVWYAEYAETNQMYLEDKLGTEVDLRADYMVNEDLKLTAVGAYLFADDATNVGAEDPSDVFEIGAMLSFHF